MGHVKRLNSKKDWGAELEHYRKNYTADLRVYNEEMSVIRSKEKKFKQEKLNEEREKELEYRLVGKHQKAIEQKKAKEQEEKEEAEAERRQNVKIRDEKMREKLHAETHELRELQAKIDAAYMNKERAAQVQRNEAARKKAADEAEENRKFINDHVAFEERAKQEAAIARVEAARKLQADLENQLIEKEKNAQLAYEQFLQEKKMIDDVVKKIEMEDAQSLQDAINKIEDHRAFIGNRDTYNKQGKWKKKLEMKKRIERIESLKKKNKDRQNMSLVKNKLKLRISIVFSNICVLNWPKSEKKKKIMKDSFKNWQFQNWKRKKVKMKRIWQTRLFELDLKCKKIILNSSNKKN